MSSSPYEAPKAQTTPRKAAGLIDLLTYRWTVVVLNGLSLAMVSVPLLMYPDAPNAGLTALMVYPSPLLGLAAFVTARRPPALLLTALAVNLIFLMIRLPYVLRFLPHAFTAFNVFLLAVAMLFVIVFVPLVTSATCFLRWRQGAVIPLKWKPAPDDSAQA